MGRYTLGIARLCRLCRRLMQKYNSSLSVTHSIIFFKTIFNHIILQAAKIISLKFLLVSSCIEANILMFYCAITWFEFTTVFLFLLFYQNMWVVRRHIGHLSCWFKLWAFPSSRPHCLNLCVMGHNMGKVDPVELRWLTCMLRMFILSLVSAAPHPTLVFPYCFTGYHEHDPWQDCGCLSTKARGVVSQSPLFSFVLFSWTGWPSWFEPWLWSSLVSCIAVERVTW